jgi:hypothetical protein
MGGLNLTRTNVTNGTRQQTGRRDLGPVDLTEFMVDAAVGRLM